MPQFPVIVVVMGRQAAAASSATLRAVDDLNAMSLPDLFRALTDDARFLPALDRSLREDLGDAGDVTTDSIIDLEATGTAHLTARQSGVVAGLAVVPQLAHRVGPDLTFEAGARDGDRCAAGTVLGDLSGSLRTLLMLERTMLNYVGHLSGIATLTHSYVEAIAGTGVEICDTRKTTPGLRHLEKYAVRCGGGTSHRLGLHDAALYKDNHLAALPREVWAMRLGEAIASARHEHQLSFVEVEVDTLRQLEEVLSLPDDLIDIVLLDNMTAGSLVRAVQLRDEHAPAVKLEASGGVSLESVRGIAESGVDRISVGALTHSAPWLDIGLDLA